MTDDAQGSGDNAPAGWYPHPSMADTQRYWDGQQWTEHIAPQSGDAGTSAAPSKNVQNQLVIAGIVAVAAVGFIMSLQSASLLSGTGTIWTGAALCVGAGIVVQIVKPMPRWVRVVVAIAAAIAIINAFSMESRLNDKREELQQQLNQLP
ncbi:DUF2510 domain-containing protein [Nocardioides ultimimeridianus]